MMGEGCKQLMRYASRTVGLVMILAFLMCSGRSVRVATAGWMEKGGHTPPYFS